MEHQHQQHQQQQQFYQNNSAMIEEIENLHNIIAMLSDRIQQYENQENSNYSQSNNNSTMIDESGYVSGHPSGLIFPRFDFNQDTEEQQERIIRVLADTAPFMMWMADANGHFVYMNSKYFEFTGASPAFGDGWSSSVHPDDQERVFSVWQSYLHERKPFKLEYRMRRHDGVYRWIIDTGSPRYSGISGSFIGYTGSCIDVTEMWHAKHEIKTFTKQQEALMRCSSVLLTHTPQRIIDSQAAADNKAKSQDYYKLALKSLAFTLLSDCAVLFLVDPDDVNLLHVVQKYNVSIEVNTTIRLPAGYWQECINLYGHSTEEDLLSLDQHSFDDPPSSPFGEDDTPARMMELIHQSSTRLICRPTIYSSFYQHYLTPIFHRLGMLSLTAEYIRGTSDHPFGFVCVAAKTEKDFSSGEQNTLRVMANILSAYIRQEEDTKSLQSQQNLTSTLSRASREGIITVDSSGLITEMNPSALELFSMNSRQMKQKHPISALFPFVTDSMRDGESFEHYMNEHIVKYRQNITFKESPATLLNGHQPFNVDLMIKEIFMQDSKVFIFLIRNKTNRTEIPAPIKNSIDSIVNMSKALVDSDIKSKSLAESILRISSTLQTLVDGLIDLSNLKLPTLKLKYDVMRLTDCVEQSQLLISPIAQKHGIEILPIYDNQLPTFIIGDMSLLRQILINLLENSINSMKDIKSLVLQVNLLNNHHSAHNRQTTTTTTSSNNTSHIHSFYDKSNTQPVFTTIQFDIKPSLSTERVQKVEEPFVDFGSGVQQCKDIIQMMGGSIQTGQNGSTYKFTISTSYVLNPAPTYNYKRKILTISTNYYRRQMLSKVWNRFNCDGDFVPRFLLKEDILNIAESNYEFVFIDFSYDQSINEFISNLSMLSSHMKLKKTIVVIIDSTFPYINRITPYIDQILIKPTSLALIEGLIKPS